MLFFVVLLSFNLSMNGYTMTNSEVSSMQELAVVNKLLDGIKSKQSVSYKVKLRIKPPFINDTTQINGFCMMQRALDDTIFGGYIYLGLGNGYEKYYDTKNVFLADSEKKSLLIGKQESAPTYITGDLAGLYIDTYFLDVVDLQNMINNPKNVVKINSDSIVNRHFWKIIINAPDDENHTDRIRIIWISKKNKAIERILITNKFQGSDVYQEWVQSDIKFNTFNNKLMSWHFDSLISVYTVKKIVFDNSIRNELLKPGTFAPAFQGTTFGNDSNIDFRGKKLYLLDFWYMGCYGCIKAIPFLVGLYNEFAPKGLEIYGLNPIDNENTQKEILKKFIEKQEITYPVVFINRKIADSLYKVEGYPSFYLINKKGEIIYTEIGYNEKKTDSLRLIIENELKREYCD